MLERVKSSRPNGVLNKRLCAWLILALAVACMMKSARMTRTQKYSAQWFHRLRKFCFFAGTWASSWSFGAALKRFVTESASVGDSACRRNHVRGSGCKCAVLGLAHDVGKGVEQDRDQDVEQPEVGEEQADDEEEA